MKRFVFVLIAFLMAATDIYAQSMNLYEKYDFYQKAYAVISEYAQTASVNNDSKAQRFKSLFESNDAMIYNDLMSLDNRTEISVNDYVKALSSASTVSVVIKNIRKGKVTDQGNTWQMPLFFEKSISFVNPCGTYIDSHEYFQCDFLLKAVVVVDKATQRCFIKQLTNESGNKMNFPKDYTVLVKNDARDEKLTIDGRIVNFNLYDQVLLHPGYKIKYLGSDVGEKSIEGDNCDHKICVKYSEKNFRAKFHSSFALGGFYSIGDASKDLSSSSSDVNFGLDIGYVFPSMSKLAVGVFTGMGYSSNKINLDLDGTYSFEKEYLSDIDGDRYSRHYNGVNCLSQTLKSTGLTIPIYVDFDYHLTSVISTYADLGVKLQTSMSNKWSTDKTSIGEIYGIYPDYQNLRLPAEGQILDINGFGTNKFVSEVDPSDFKMSMGIASLFGLGIRANIGKSLVADFGIQYQMGLTHCWKNEVNAIDFNKGGELIRWDGEKEQMVPLLNTASNLKQSSLRLQIGLIYKF